MVNRGMFISIFSKKKARYELQSAMNTVVSAMIVELGIQVFSHQEFWDPTLITKGLLIACGLAIIRAAWKAGLVFALSLIGLKAPIMPQKKDNEV